jgi:hypothetical protein
VQSENGVVHLIAEKLWAPTVDMALPEVGSRDFH